MWISVTKPFMITESQSSSASLILEQRTCLVPQSSSISKEAVSTVSKATFLYQLLPDLLSSLTSNKLEISKTMRRHHLFHGKLVLLRDNAFSTMVKYTDSRDRQTNRKARFECQLCLLPAVTLFLFLLRNE